MDYNSSKEIKINYIYLEFPKKEYYMVSNLDANHSFNYIKPIGQDLTDFLNMDLKCYEDNLESLKNTLLDERTPFRYKVHAFESFSIPYAQENFIYLIYVHNPVITEVNTIITAIYSGADIRIPISAFKRWYQRVYNYFDLQKKYRKFASYIFNLDKKRFVNHQQAILKANDDFPSIVNTELKKTITSVPMINGRLNQAYIKEINDAELSVMEKSQKAFDDSANFGTAFQTKITSLNEGLFYEFSELVKNGYRIGKCKSCKRFFLMTTKRDIEYCKHKNDNGLTCAQNASKAKYKESMQDIFLEKYDKKLATVYQNYYRAKDLDEDELTGSELTYSEYADWRDEAMVLRKNYISERERISKDLTLSPQKKYRDKQKLGEKFLKDLSSIYLPHRSGRKEHGIKINE